MSSGLRFRPENRFPEQNLPHRISLESDRNHTNSIAGLMMLSHRDSIDPMIASFQDDETRKVWEGERSRKLPPQIQPVARRKLRMLNNARRIEDLRVPPRKLSGVPEGNTPRSVEHPDQQSVARVFCLARRQLGTNRNLRLSLRALYGQTP